jgi:hypothetical protein
MPCVQQPDEIWMGIDICLPHVQRANKILEF